MILSFERICFCFCVSPRRKSTHVLEIGFAWLMILEYATSSRAQEKRAAVNKVPEQIILSEVRRMVEEMQALNKKLEETEAAIEEYFGPIDKQAEMIMKMQLEGEEKTMKEMMKAMQRQTLLEKEAMEKFAKVNQAGEPNQPKQSADEEKAANS
ncbi:uncharacterized protein LOC116200717 isoform X1 [Punica granatum]|uniref:Uncharacterized protein LOC116200717 isoform X1 n=1 Tax=Punica granatum TaxID=22663 RepID=A0A6P8D804_PUNGR|nr:uncharacterized protein LOC116200717 isoform X1 [Punica granatum]